MKVRKGDRVRVLSGKDRGREGEVTFAYPADGTVIVDGMNIARKHQGPRQGVMQTGIIDKEMPIRASSVAVLSPADGQPTRVGYRFDTDGRKVRICRRTGVDL